ncbi:MAG TPA: hypothetical protein VN861_12690, partial [Candidatus Acidoferrales bacterium]|nr:hypothetical protein [Candidatus Acidoferrales bacterium]
DAIKKNRQFLAKPAGMRYSFSESLIYSARTSLGDARAGIRLRTGNDSGMAPQGIEIAQNGLEDPPAPGWEGESISV